MYSYDANYIPVSKRINGLEWLIMIFSVLLVIGIGLWGFFAQESLNHDKQRQFDIVQQVIPAIADFYKNSSTIENKRFYPVAICSGNLNEVDYELTLRQHLTGQLIEIDAHNYISNDNFPKDRFGTYSQTFSERKVPFRCPEKLSNYATIQSSPGQKIYSNYPSCNFRRNQNHIKCYLYTSSNSGDSFEIGYFSEAKNCFVVYRKFRSQEVQSNVQCNF